MRIGRDVKEWRAEGPTKTATEVLRYAGIVMWSGLAIAAFVQWLKRRREAEAWIAATFGLLGIISLTGLFFSQDPSKTPPQIATKILIGSLALFPYFLFRFAGTFKPTRRAWHVAAIALTAAVILDGAVTRFAAQNAPREKGVQVFLAIFVAQWVALSMYQAVVLWRGGRNQPRVVRIRMRTMAAAATALSVILIAAGSSPQQQHSVSQLVTQIATLFIAPLFLLGFAPPRRLVWVWRMKDEEALRDVERSLLKSAKPEDVADALLPSAVRTVGGNAGVLRDRDGTIIGMYGDDEAISVLLHKGIPEEDHHVAYVPMDSGSLAVSISPFAPYFGRETMGVLSMLASLTDLALARAEILADQARVAEELRIANETMKEFVAIASHDLRTPLTVVLGLADLLSNNWDRFDDATKHQQVTAIKRQGAQLARLVEDLLAISRIEMGAAAPAAQNVEVKPFIERTIKDLGDELPSIAVDVTDHLVALADSDHMTRMLVNYLLNARNYGELPIRVVAGRQNGNVTFRVIDAGAGVPEGYRDRLFEKFFRANRTKSKEAQGTGLGLAIVRGLAQAAGGDAWYEQTTEGACFAFSVPAAGK